MDDRRFQWRIGATVLLALLATATLMMLFGPERSIFNLKSWQPKYVVHIRFSEAPGVSDNTPVRKSGILIGRVTRVELLDEGGAEVTAEINRDRKLFNNEVCRINRSLLGDSILEFVHRRDWTGSKQLVEPGATLQGVVAPDPIQVVGALEENITGVMGSVADTSQKLGNFIERLDGLLGSEADLAERKARINAIIDKTYETSDAIRQLAVSSNELLGDPKVRQQLRDTLEQMPLLMKEARQTVARMNQTMNLVDKNLRNVEDFTQALGEQGGDTLARLNQGADKLDRVMGEVLMFSESLNQSKGTIGQLVHNPELYNSLNSAINNVQELSQQLQPIVHDVRVFTDKIARHPELLGVRGAIRPDAGAKGTPQFGLTRRFQ